MVHLMCMILSDLAWIFRLDALMLGLHLCSRCLGVQLGFGVRDVLDFVLNLWICWFRVRFGFAGLVDLASC